MGGRDFGDIYMRQKVESLSKSKAGVLLWPGVSSNIGTFNCCWIYTLREMNHE
ncbi:hypothetical protein BJX66DRAFT_296251 [Aspergillus keveii]|uniref:Uncharacterized protein n=1 Tax=Aspergillus keveii TaxID=714993 RepID=A0ABR4GG43_9EURO